MLSEFPEWISCTSTPRKFNNFESCVLLKKASLAELRHKWSGSSGCSLSLSVCGLELKRSSRGGKCAFSKPLEPSEPSVQRRRRAVWKSLMVLNPGVCWKGAAFVVCPWGACTVCVLCVYCVCIVCVLCVRGSGCQVIRGSSGFCLTGSHHRRPDLGDVVLSHGSGVHHQRRRSAQQSQGHQNHRGRYDENNIY